MSTQRIQTIRPHIVNWGWALSGQSLQTVLQAGAFLVLARSLPVRDLGIFVSLTALTAILSPFSGLGAGNLLIRDVARDPAVFPKRWNTLFVVTLGTGTVLCLVTVAVYWSVFPHFLSWYEISLFAVCDLLLFRWAILASLTFQGLGWMRQKSQLEIFSGAVRLGAALVLLRLPASLRQIKVWLFLYLATAVLVFAAAQFMTLPHFGMPRRWGAMRAILHDLSDWKWRQGLWFAVSPSTQVVNNDADKFMLARLASPSQAGVYGAAYRVLTAAFLPVQALLVMTYPRFFREGGRGIHHSGRYAWRWAPAALGYSLVAAGLIFACAPLVVKLLGREFRDTAFVLRQLAILPCLKAVQFLFADSLSGADYQQLRVLLQAGAAVLNVVLNLLWIPELGWHGAVRATLVCDSALAASFVFAQLWLRRAEREASQFA